MGLNSGLAQLYAILRRRLHLAVPAFLLPLVAGMGLAMFLSNMYRSSCLVLVERSHADDGRWLEARLKSLHEENLSESHLLELIDRFKLYPSLQNQASQEQLAKRMRSDIAIETRKAAQGWGSATVAFSITYLASDPETAATVANTLAAFYPEKQRRDLERWIRQRNEALLAQIQTLADELAQEASAVRDFKRLHHRELPEHLSANLTAIEQLSAALQANRRTQEIVLNVAPTLNAQTSSATDATRSERRQQLLAAKAKLSQLGAVLTPKHPDVRRLRAKIAALASGKEARPTASQLQAELQALQEREKKVMRALTMRVRHLDNSGLRAQQLAELLPSYKAAEIRYREATERYAKVQLDSALDGTRGSGVFHIVDRARSSSVPVAPNRLRLMQMSLIFALLLSGAVVVLAEKSDTTFHSVDELRAFTPAPVLATLPRIVTPVEMTRRYRHALALITLLVLLMAGVLALTYAYAHNNHQLLRLVASRLS